MQQAKEALAKFGAERFDFLINTAGVSHHALFEKTTEAELDLLYNVNFKGVFFRPGNCSRSSTMAAAS